MNFYFLKRLVHGLSLLFFLRNRLRLIKYFFRSNSQLHQDLFVLSVSGLKRDGFFVEFGACNGTYLSNSLLLEKEFEWRGILCEPCKIWHNDLRLSRSVHIDTRCVWRASGELIEFSEDLTDAAFSGAAETNNVYEIGRTDLRNLGTYSQKYFVESVSLNDLLKDNGDIREIDFLSIDTEGSEFEILKGFDFEKYRVGILCVEHNYKAYRETIYKLLISKGFVRKFAIFSRFDDWYVNPNYRSSID
jgi:FkbM family methyltransferase